MYVKVYKRQCPDCRQTWGAQLSEANVIRIGKETFTCKCGKQWLTGRDEWAHLSSEQKREYFFSQAEIGVAIICVAIPPLFAFFIGGNGWRSAMAAGLWGSLAAAVIVGFLWTLKMIFVSLSLRRCPHDVPDIRGLWPWEW